MGKGNSQVRSVQGCSITKPVLRFWTKWRWGEVKQPKFLHPKGQEPTPYFSPLKDWSQFTKGDTVYICESYLKADTVARLGHYAIGFSGIWGWSHKRKMAELYTRIPWELQNSVIIFDSGVVPEHPKLYLAVQRLDFNIGLFYGKCGWLQLPPPEDGSDWGIDDFCAEHGDDTTRELLKQEPEPIASDLRSEMMLLNEECAVVRELGRIVEFDSGVLHRRSEFEHVVYADRIAMVFQDGKEVPKPVSVAKSWIQWPERNVVQRVVYSPGDELVRAGEFYNLWRGMGCQPIEGDVSLWEQWGRDFFEPAEWEWFCDWWAWQLQNLGGKLNTMLILVGTSGVGKGWTASVFSKIFGMHNIAINTLDNLTNKFNSDLGDCQLLIVEEAGDSSAYKKDVYTKLKDLVTSEYLRIERKGVDSFMVDNHVNVFLSGNDINMVQTDAYDRRLAVLEPSNLKLEKDATYWQPKWDWTRDEEGCEAIYWWLLQRDLAGFDPKGEPPFTHAKEDMIRTTNSDAMLWLEELRHGRVDLMGYEDDAVFSARELYWIFKEGSVGFDEIDVKDMRAFSGKVTQARLQHWRPTASGKVKDPRGNQTRWYEVGAGVGASLGDKSPPQFLKDRTISKVLYHNDVSSEGKY